MRRSIGQFLILMFGTVLLARGAPAETRFAAILEAKFKAGLAEIESGLDGILGVAIKDLKTGKTFFLNEREVFPQASSIKIAILLEVFRQAQEGKIGLDEFLTVDEGLKVGGSGVLNLLGRPSLSLSVRDTAVLMVVLSDNTATNLLIDKVGMEAVNKRMASLGLRGTKLQRRMMDLAAASEGRENLSTPLEMMTLLEKIWTGDALGEAYRKELLDILALPKDSPLRAGVPGTIAVAAKPGGLEAVRCDSGIVMLPGRPYVICVMTTYLKRDADGDPAIAQISRLVFEHYSRLERSSEYGRIVSER